ncbi:MAG: hypothetical protein KDA77_02475 [Planctomycetaceae bacterium]|nr:hypothetical protein [Planctomycetaceae bacterium]
MINLTADEQWDLTMFVRFVFFVVAKMKPFNKKYFTLVLLGVSGILAAYYMLQEARAQIASINAVLDSLLQDGCQIQVERCNHP